jgi:type II secretory pathway component GspD/PulD (secretin)
MSVARSILVGGLIWSPVFMLVLGRPAASQDKVTAPVTASTPAYSPAGGAQVVELKAAEGGAITPEVMAAMRAAHEKGGGGPNKTGSLGQPSGKPDDAKAKETAPTIHRPTASASLPNREEFKIRPNAAGEVRLNFTNQPWQPVLEWLASISAMSLDWQDLPGDTLNLTTRRSYKLPEVRDLINEHLLARGFTLLCNGESMSVVEIKKIDPSMVPRVEPADLAKREPHEFVKVSFPLETFSAEAAKNELTPMLSPNGKLFALNETSRLEAMDAVVNLRDIESVLKQQQARASQPKTFREFKLKYARAADVHKLLSALVGSESPAMPGQPGQPGGMNPQQQAEMMARMQAQGGGQGQPQPNAAAAAAKESVSIAVNAHNNSILVQAKPDKMAIIAQIIEAVDIPADRNTLTMANMGRMQVYRLSGIDLEPVVKTLMDVGNLDPSTRLEIDKKNSAIIAYAPLADHVTIRALVDKLTGSDRKFEVIPLRRLAADYVAGTIEFMLGSGQKKEQRRSPWSYYDSPREDEKKSREFRVDADVEHNRLLLWANQAELAEVQALLVKLGEIPVAGSGSSNVRVIEGGDAKENEEFLERLRKVWPSVAPNELQTPAPPAASEENRDRGVKPSTAEKPATTTTYAPVPGEIARRLHGKMLRFADTKGEQAYPTSEENAPVEKSSSAQPAPPPVKITIGADGKLIVSSKDVQALDMLESLAAEMPVGHKGYKIFHLKYALASSVAMNLEDFFKEKKEKSQNLPWYFYDYDMSNQDDSKDDHRLSNRKKLKFISDIDTNTILVDGADAQQLKTIDELIQVYDQPPPSDSQSVRKTELIRLRYSKAKAVADTVKDVYRDLLSSNDKALAENNQNGGGRRVVINYGTDTDASGLKTPRFKGLLSIGVDETSNSLLVSAPAFLFDHVSHMIIELDKAAAPEYEVRVVRIGPSVSAERVKDLLDQVYNNKQPEKPEEKPAVEKRSSAKPSQRGKSGTNGKSQRQRESDEKKDAG